MVFDGGFHGRSLFTLSATANPAYKQGFEPLVPGIREARFGDLDSVDAVLGPQTAAVLVEPVQGEGGVRPATREFLQGLRERCDANGSLLIFDEVQCGMGRTGKLFAYQHYGVVPDVMTLAKALGNGIPIGAMLTTARIGGALVPGTHGSTFGGNLLAAACAVAVLDELTEGGVLAHSKRVAEYLGERPGKARARPRRPRRRAARPGSAARHRGARRSRQGGRRAREEGLLVITAGADGGAPGPGADRRRGTDRRGAAHPGARPAARLSPAGEGRARRARSPRPARRRAPARPAG